MFSEFPCDMRSQRALHFCGIIEKVKIYSWSDEVIEKLKEIAVYYEEGEEENAGKGHQGAQHLGLEQHQEEIGI